MVVLHDYRLHVGYHAGWTKEHPVDVVNRLKRSLRDEVRKVFDDELMAAWDSPRRRGKLAEAVSSLLDLGLEPDEKEFADAVSHLDHSESETEAPLAFVTKRLAQVNARKQRSFVPETGGSSLLVEGCLYVDHVWTKIESFALFENGRPWVITAVDSAPGRTRVEVPMLATLIYECELD